ncbi:hypothetical protein C7212DRAFT_364566 [Tuber magnatum]|uniref:Uncharacterized protein n=1 Tax=Tuber magnatum TaxID=42249 RepID=A0A317SLQ0_9PEZI|nr:hypothetical protein C7212DRAFT_364566 [Tuber magnatum]
MLSIKGMLGAESPVRPRRSADGEQQPPSLRSSPESQNPRERERGTGDSPRDREGVGILLAAMGAEYASASEEDPTTRTRRGPQPPPTPPPPPTATKRQKTSSQNFRRHSPETNTFFNLSHESNRQPPMISDFREEKQSTPYPSHLGKRKVSGITGSPAPAAAATKQKPAPLPQYTDSDFCGEKQSTPYPSSHLGKRKVSEITGSPAPAPAATRQKRAPRPQYTKEQEDFIWFCRDDLAMSWRKVVELYNAYWHPYESEPHIRSESGLQSRYYRILDFPVKVRKKKEPSRPDLGLIPSTNRRYYWMGVLPDAGRCWESKCGGLGMAVLERGA